MSIIIFIKDKEGEPIKAILIGYGEIGRALHEVYGKKHDISVWDTRLAITKPQGEFEIMLIAIPYTPSFAETVNAYREEYKPSGIIIFSSVAIGTTNQIPGAVHSPVEGVHPRLARSIEIMR